MKAIAFNTTIEGDTIALPGEQTDIKNGQKVKVIVLIENEDIALEKLSESQFLNGYASEDAKYDNY